MGLGVLARECDGVVKWFSTQRVCAWWTITIAEGKAVCLALRLAKIYGLSEFILESDWQAIASQLFVGSFFQPDLDTILHDPLLLSSNLFCVYWSHIRRDGNSVIYHLPRVVPFDVEQR